MSEENKKNPAIWEYESEDSQKAAVLRDAL